MKTEEFDDAIKRKVEGINHKFTENDVEKVHKFVIANRGPLWLRGPFRKLFIFSATGLILTGFITWQLTRMHDREILNQTIASLRKDYIKKDVATSNKNVNLSHLNNNKSLTDNNIQNNTSAQNSPITTDNANQKLNIEAMARNDNNLASTKISNSKKSINNNSKATIETLIRRKTKTSQFTNADNTSKQPKNKNISNFEMGLKNIDNLIPISKTKNQLNSENKNYPNQKTDQAVNSITSQNNVNLANNQNNKALNNSNSSGQEGQNKIDDKFSSEKTNSSPKINEKLTSETKVVDSMMSPKTYRGPKYDKNPSKNRVNIRFQAGLGAIGGFDAVNHLIGGQISGEMLINNMFSLSSGINTITLASKKFDTDDDFSSDCPGKNFNQNELHVFTDPWYHEYENANITIQELLVQVPVNITYYIPFKNHWAFSISAGTDIDVYSHQTLLYDQLEKLNQSVFCHIEQKNTIVPFNNITGSIGILKQFGRLAVQVSPYISYQLTPVDYKLENIYYGANLRLMLNFGKGGF